MLRLLRELAGSEGFLLKSSLLDNVPPPTREGCTRTAIYLALLNKQPNRVTILAYWEVTSIES